MAMTDDLRALLADLNTWPMYLSRDGDGNDLTTVSKGQVAAAIHALIAAHHEEPATARETPGRFSVEASSGGDSPSPAPSRSQQGAATTSEPATVAAGNVAKPHDGPSGTVAPSTLHGNSTNDDLRAAVERLRDVIAKPGKPAVWCADVLAALDAILADHPEPADDLQATLDRVVDQLIHDRAGLLGLIGKLIDAKEAAEAKCAATTAEDRAAQPDPTQETT